MKKVFRRLSLFQRVALAFAVLAIGPLCIASLFSVALHFDENKNVFIFLAMALSPAFLCGVWLLLTPLRQLGFTLEDVGITLCWLLNMWSQI